MSTRCTTHFQENGRTVAIIYRHWDGYPSSAGADLLRFIDACAELSDARFSDPTYLAAKYVVFLAGIFREKKAISDLDFLSVGIVQEDPEDIEYRYAVECGDRSAGHMRNGKPAPVVRCERPNGVAVAIPEPQAAA